MRWQDEPWVKLYTRDTPEFLALSWVARGLFGLVMRKVDRAGLLKVGRLGLKGVAVAVGGPWSEVEAPLRELLDDECLVYDEASGVVLIPNFIEAQDARQSDAARKRVSRERARAGVKAPSADKGHVYVVRSTRTGLIRVGFSSAWTNRIRAMATDHGAPLDVMLVLAGVASDVTAWEEIAGSSSTKDGWVNPSEGVLQRVQDHLDLDARTGLDVTPAGHHVTPAGQADSPAGKNVTRGHTRSHAVTRGHDKNRSEENRSEETPRVCVDLVSENNARAPAHTRQETGTHTQVPVVVPPSGKPSPVPPSAPTTPAPNAAPQPQRRDRPREPAPPSTPRPAPPPVQSHPNGTPPPSSAEGSKTALGSPEVAKLAAAIQSHAKAFLGVDPWQLAEGIEGLRISMAKSVEVMEAEIAQAAGEVMAKRSAGTEVTPEGAAVMARRYCSKPRAVNMTPAGKGAPNGQPGGWKQGAWDKAPVLVDVGPPAKGAKR